RASGAWSVRPRVLNRAPHAVGGRGHVELSDADGREGIDDRVHDDGQGPDRAGLARALGAHRIERRRYRIALDVHVGKRIPAWHRIVHERRGQELTGLAVVDDLLHERLTHALRHAAVDLALEGHRIDDRPHVVDDYVAHDRDGAGVRIDLHLAHVAAVGPRGLRGREGPGLVEPGLDPRRQL